MAYSEHVGKYLHDGYRLSGDSTRWYQRTNETTTRPTSDGSRADSRLVRSESAPRMSIIAALNLATGAQSSPDLHEGPLGRQMQRSHAQ
jgi:hypothetical protein